MHNYKFKSKEKRLMNLYCKIVILAFRIFRCKILSRLNKLNRRLERFNVYLRLQTQFRIKQL